MDRTSELKKTGAHHFIYSTLNMLLTKSLLPIDRKTNNRAEIYMSLLACFNMGKRLNLVQRDLSQIRSYLAALKYNKAYLWHSEVYT